MSSSGNPSALVALAPVTKAPASTPTSAIAVVTQPVSRLLPAPAPMAAMNAKPISGPPCAPVLAEPDADAVHPATHRPAGPVLPGQRQRRRAENSRLDLSRCGRTGPRHQLAAVPGG